MGGEFVCFEQPDLFKPIQSVQFDIADRYDSNSFQVIAVLVLISLGSASPVEGNGVLWFIALSSLVISTTATILLMFNKEGMSGLNIHFADAMFPWSVIVSPFSNYAFGIIKLKEFVYSSILALLCGIGLWISFGYATNVSPAHHSAGYVFAGVNIFFYKKSIN
jgi:hypothetical protein